MGFFHHVVQDLALVMLVAAAIGLIFQKLKQPLILGYLLAGLIVGPYMPIPLFAEPERLHLLSEVGVIAVMFLLGLKFKISKLINILPISGFTVLIQVCVMNWLGFSLGQYLGWSQLQSIFLGASICVPSTMIVSSIFEHKKVTHSTSQFVYGALIIQDVVAIVIITVVTALTAGYGLEPSILIRTVSNLILAVIGMLILGLMVMPKILKNFLQKKNQELLAIVGTAVCFSFAFLSQYLGYSVALGAFIAGVILAESGKSYQLEYILRPIKNIFVAIFFVSVGMTIDPTQVFEHFAIICLVSLIVIVGQYGSVVLSSLLTGQNAKKAFQSAAALSQVGEFGFIIAGIGSLNQAAHPSLTSIVVSVSVITAFICPWLISHSDKFLQFSEHLIPKRLVLAFSLYIQMLEGFKTGQKQSWRKTNLYRAFKWILVDTVILLLLLAMALPIIQKYAVIILQKNHMPESWSKPLLYVSIATILMPFLGLIFFNSRKLATEVTYSILEQSLTSSSTQRGLKHIFSVMVYMGIYLLVGIPVLAVIRPFLQGPHILPVFLTISLLSVVYIYIRTSDLEIQTRSIVQEFTDFIQGRSLASYPQSMPELSQELYQVESFTVSEEDYANQKNLLDLNLRQATGASAIAIHRNEGDVLLPRGKEILLHNDTLILTGTKQAIVKAIQHLKKGRINE